MEVFSGIMGAISSLTTPKTDTALTTTELEAKELENSAKNQRLYIMVMALVFLLGLGATVYIQKSK